MDKKLIVLDLDGTTLKKRRNHLLAYEKCSANSTR